MSTTADLALSERPRAGTSPGDAVAASFGVRRRSWAAAGAAAAVSAVVSMVASGAFGSGTAEEGTMGDNALAAATLADQRGALAVHLASATVTALLLVVFASGLRRRLDAQCPPGGLLASVAAGGLALCAALSLVGAGIGTELFWGLGALADGEADPDSMMSMYHLVATMSWVWAGAGLAAGAVAVAALRHGALPRWMGWVSAVLVVLVVGISLVPLQYLSAMSGAVWLLVVSVGLLASRERAV